jgi:hypothetical protein
MHGEKLASIGIPGKRSAYQPVAAAWGIAGIGALPLQCTICPT